MVLLTRPTNPHQPMDAQWGEILAPLIRAQTQSETLWITQMTHAWIISPLAKRTAFKPCIVIIVILMENVTAL